MAGFVYFGIVFVAGFLLGVVRTVWLALEIGEFAAVAVEMPFILAVSWISCGWCLGKFALSSFRQRACMGISAFSLLMTAEALLATAVFGLSLANYAAGFLTIAGLLGLAGQVAFAVFPVIHPIGKASSARR